LLIGFWIGFTVCLVFFPGSSPLPPQQQQPLSSLLRATIRIPQVAREAAAPADGWKDIHVFYGTTKHLTVEVQQAQAEQDKIAAGLLRYKKNGYFVDLAAHSATYLSNTYALEQKYNWGGSTCALFLDAIILSRA
jgi:hypothetical protein